MPTPLEVLLGVMNRRWAAGDEDAAVALAKAAAPYVHPRAQARAITDIAGMDDDELRAMDSRDGVADPAAGEP